MNPILLEEMEILRMTCDEFLGVSNFEELNKATVKSYVRCIEDTIKEIKRIYTEEYGEDV